MPDRRALVVRTPAAAGARSNGASLRVDDVVALLAATGYDVSLSTPSELAAHSGRYDVGVAVSYVSAAALRTLRSRCARTWLDAVDSWVHVNRTGLQAGHVSYAARAARDALRLGTAPSADLVTWISDADRAADRWTVRGRRRLVLPGSATALDVTECEQRRLVLAGDWDYLPNRAGLRWFVRRVLPRLTSPVHVFGSGRVPAADGLIVHGHVADPGHLLGSGDVHLAPVPFGGGVKRKVLQPLLAGLPVVTTRHGAHGLRRHPLLSVEDRAPAFAAAVRARLDTPQRRWDVSPQDVHDADDRREVERWLGQSIMW